MIMNIYLLGSQVEIMLVSARAASSLLAAGHLVVVVAMAANLGALGWNFCLTYTSM